MTAATVRLLSSSTAAVPPDDHVPDLYCFPHAGGGVATFLPWKAALEGQARVHAIGYPDAPAGTGRTITSVAAAIAVRLRPESGSIFLGHSMGTLVAFETIRELRRRGLREPAVLVVAAHAAPHLQPEGRLLHQLPSDLFWREVAAMGGTSDEVSGNPELRQATEPRLRSDFTACETYRFSPGPPLTCRVLAFAGEHDHQARPGSMEPWRLHTLSDFSLTSRPGGHFFLHDDPHALMTDVLEQSAEVQLERR